MDRHYLALFRYFVANKITGMVILYMLVSVILKSLTSIDISIPCLWLTLFDFECPGCGITTALTYILRLDFERAYEANKLILILLPAAMSYLYFDLMKFRKRVNEEI